MDLLRLNRPIATKTELPVFRSSRRSVVILASQSLKFGIRELLFEYPQRQWNGSPRSPERGRRFPTAFYTHQIPR
jgi:hypothetical protein